MVQWWLLMVVANHGYISSDTSYGCGIFMAVSVRDCWYSFISNCK